MSKQQAERTYLRWDAHQRLQHLMAMVSVSLLLLTGVPLRFPTTRTARVIMAVVGGPDTAAIVHRGAAVLLMLAGLYHGLYLLGRWRRRQLSYAILPVWKDVQDFFGMLRYFVGLSPTKPLFDRYTFTEKFEYWAMVWGSAVMILTGLLLWFSVQAVQVLPVVVLPIAKVIHGYEALLAGLSLILWHFYHVHLNPDVFPMSKVWLTGRISEQELRHHHPLEYERLKAMEERSDDDSEAVDVEPAGIDAAPGQVSVLPAPPADGRLGLADAGSARGLDRGLEGVREGAGSPPGDQAAEDLPGQGPGGH